MSLKSKIEAVIYAAEEPVTLAQLSSIFGAEVLASIATVAVPEPPSGTPEAEAAPETEPFPSLEAAEAALIEDAFADASSSATRIDTATGPDIEAELSTVGLSTGEPAPPDANAAEKREARLRERTVREHLRQVVAELIDEYATGDRGMEIREIAGGYRVTTKPEYHDAVRAFVKSLKPPLKLSLQALETLAVIAYKQPVTAPEVSEIRGVDSGGVLGGLMGRKLITTAGRKQVIGRPILYKTTKEFLLRFGLKDVNELPSIEEFEKMAGEIEIEEPPEAEPAAITDALPFDEATDPVEANAGEPGVAVSTPVDSAVEVAPVAVDPDGPSEAVSLDASGDGSTLKQGRTAADVELASEQSVGVGLEDG